MAEKNANVGRLHFRSSIDQKNAARETRKGVLTTSHIDHGRMHERVMSNKLVKIAGDSAKGGFSLFLGNALSTVILAVGSILVARLLGPESYGLFALSLVVPAFLGQIISLGIDQALTRFSSKHRIEGRPQLAASFLKSGFTFKLLAGVAMSAIGFVFSDFFAANVLNRSELDFLIKLASLGILFQVVFTALNSSFTGLDRAEKSALTMGFQSIAKTTLALLLIILGFGVAGAVGGHVLSYMVAAVLGSIILFIGPYRSLRASSDYNGNFLGDLKSMVDFGFPLYLSTLTSIFLNQYQFMLLAFYASDLQIGNFNAALNFTALLNTLNIPVATALFPAFSKFNPRSEMDELRRFFRFSTKYASLFIVPATVVVATLSKDLVSAIYGSSFELAPQFLALYAISFLYTGIGSLVLGSFLSGIGETKLNLKIGLVNAIVFAFLALLLTQLYSVLGLILAFLISNFVSIAYGLITAQRRFGASPNFGDSLRVYLVSFLSALPTLVFVQLLPLTAVLNVVLGGSLFGFTYLTLAPLLGAVSTFDIESLKNIFARLKLVGPILKLMLDYESKLISTFT